MKIFPHASLALAILLGLTACGSNGPTPPAEVHGVGVTVQTTGVDIDPTGYTITVDGASQSVAANGSLVFEGLEAGTYDVTISDVSPNCSIAGGATLSVAVANGQSGTVSFDVVCASVVATGDFNLVACPAVSLSQTSAAPLTAFDIGTLPAELTQPLFARISTAGSDAYTVAIALELEGGSVALVAPFHPSGSMDGGAVEVQLAGGVFACAAEAFTIEGLAAAPDETEEIVDLMQQLIALQAELIGTTVSELQALDGTDVPTAHLIPILLVQSIVDHPGNPNSLRAIVNGTAPLTAGMDRDAIDRVLAATGLRTALESVIAGALPAAARATGPARIDAVDCLVIEIDTPQELSDCMDLAQSAAFRIDGVSGEVLSDISRAAGAVGALPNPAVQVGAAAASALVFALQTARAGTAGLLPSSLVTMELEATPVSFFEDQPGPGAWAATVGAASQGWELDQTVLGALAQLAGGLGTYASWLRRFVPSETIDLAGVVLNQVVTRAIGVSGGAMILYIAPETFGPIDVSEEMWTERTITPEIPLVTDGHNGYQPVEPGTSTLAVRTKTEKFGGQTIDKQEELSVLGIQITVIPDDVALVAGQVDTFSVEVVNALHPDSVELLPAQSLQGSASLNILGNGPHQLIYTAPAEPQPGTTDLVAVRHTGQGGARGASGAEVIGDVTIRFSDIDLAPVLGCVAPGQDVQLQWSVTALDDPDLQWTWTAGSVSPSGVFTAPNEIGEVTITVTVAGNPQLTDTITVDVTGCTCSFTMQVGSFPAYVAPPGSSVSYFSAEGAVPGEPYAIGSVSFESADGSSAYISVEIPTIAVTGPGDYPIDVTAGGLGLEGPFYFDDTQPPQGTLRIVEYEPHTTLIGEVLGGVVVDSFDPDGPEYSFSATFQVYPPEGSLGWNYSCNVPAPEGG